VSVAAPSELVERFDCFGATVTLSASGASAGDLRTALGFARRLALDVHQRLTRYESSSELSRLNADPRPAAPASAMLRRFARAVHWAGATSGGLVDATCSPPGLPPGWRAHREPVAAGGWRHVRAGQAHVLRPPGVHLDSGGLAKGLAADLMAAALAGCPTWMVDCRGDLRIGGTSGREREVHVADPFDADAVLHTLRLRRGAVATSGITRRAWAGGHHLTDPRTGRPADTGLVQVTAVAETGLQAEVRAKAALLAGPGRAAGHLPAGGVLVTADGELLLVPGVRR
jgi:thiamine biosynthesis lipoprotein